MLKTITKTKLEPTVLNFEIDTTSSIPKISVREYMRNFTVYNQKVMDGETFIIAKNDEEQVMLSTPPMKKKKKYSMKDLFTLPIKSNKGGDPYLSEKVDQIVYGI